MKILKLQPGRRRRLSNEQKRFLLTDAVKQHGSVSAVGRAYDIPVSLLYRWRRELDLPASKEDVVEPTAPTSSLVLRVRKIEEGLEQLMRDTRSLLDQGTP
ncbi:MAG: transposase [Deltaproteobacteria bacterium]|nr:transposase [Deltaproteobacteria bacterium]